MRLRALGLSVPQPPPEGPAGPSAFSPITPGRRWRAAPRRRPGFPPHVVCRASQLLSAPYTPLFSSRPGPTLTAALGRGVRGRQWRLRASNRCVSAAAALPLAPVGRGRAGSQRLDVPYGRPAFHLRAWGASAIRDGVRERGAGRRSPRRPSCPAPLEEGLSKWSRAAFGRRTPWSYQEAKHSFSSSSTCGSPSGALQSAHPLLFCWPRRTSDCHLAPSVRPRAANGLARQRG